jgi:hypothetical protein
MDADDAAFIYAKVRERVPLSAVARMVGRPLADVRLVIETMRCGEKPPPRKPAPAIECEPDYSGRLVQTLFKGVIRVPHKTPDQTPTMLGIAKDVAARYQITVEDLRGAARVRWIAWPRQEAFALCYETGLWSYPQIGDFFGGRDHTTVMHGEKRHNERRAEWAADAMAVAAE